MDTVRLPLNNRKRPALCVVFDAADEALVRQFKWQALEADGRTYARGVKPHESGIGRHHVSAHQLIMAVQNGVPVDHVDGDGLNNTRSNLRVATHAQNAANRGKSTKTANKYKGAHYDKSRGRWSSQIKVHYEKVWLGTFASEADAARAYDRAAIYYFGGFAHLNFPREDYEGETLRKPVPPPRKTGRPCNPAPGTASPWPLVKTGHSFPASSPRPTDTDAPAER